MGPLAFVYDDLQEKILSKSIRPADIARAQSIFSPETMDVWAALLAKIEATPNDDALWQALYAAFVNLKPTTDFLYVKLKTDLDLRMRLIEAEPAQTRGNVIAWGWGYEARSLIEAFRYCKEQRFLDEFVATCDTVLSYRDDKRGMVDALRSRSVKSWGHDIKVNGKPTYVAECANTGMILLPMALFCEIVKQNPSLEAKYGDKAREYLQAAEEGVWEFEDICRITDQDEAYYYFYPGGPVDALNHTHLLGSVFVVLASITGEGRYRDRVEQLCRYFKTCIMPLENGSYVWGYVPEPEPREKRNECRPEYSQKAGVTVLMPVLAYQRGLFFSAADMQAITTTFLKNIYLGANRFNHTISWARLQSIRQGVENGDRDLVTLGSLMGAFIPLTDYDPRVRLVLEETIAARRDLFPKGWFSHRALTLAFCQRLQRLSPPNEHLEFQDAHLREVYSQDFETDIFDTASTSAWKKYGPFSDTQTVSVSDTGELTLTYNQPQDISACYSYPNPIPDSVYVISFRARATGIDGILSLNKVWEVFPRQYAHIRKTDELKYYELFFRVPPEAKVIDVWFFPQMDEAPISGTLVIDDFKISLIASDQNE